MTSLLNDNGNIKIRLIIAHTSLVLNDSQNSSRLKLHGKFFTHTSLTFLVATTAHLTSSHLREEGLVRSHGIKRVPDVMDGMGMVGRTW